jgi:hypothetical protein
MSLLMMLFLVATIALLFVLVPIVAETFARYRPVQIVRCPKTGTNVRVQLDATLAALTAVPGPPKLRVDRCDLWPEHQDCRQDCVRLRT